MDKLAMVSALTDGEATTEQAIAFLTKAESVILRRLDPLDVANITEVPNKYEMLQCELAARYFYRRGGEGEISHNENGVNRSYSSVNDEDLLREIMPYVRVMG